jgi:hypothetical protein
MRSLRTLHDSEGRLAQAVRMVGILIGWRNGNFAAVITRLTRQHGF